VTLTIRLLGPPAIERDGRPAPPPRGRKAWALLAFLLLTDQPDDPVPLLALGGELLEVARNPMEEGNHELLVRSLAAAGDRAAALRQVAVGADILCRELGAVASQLDWTACAGRSPTPPPAATRRCRARPLSPSAGPGPRDPGPRRGGRDRPPRGAPAGDQGRRPGHSGHRSAGAGVRGMGHYPTAFRYLEGSVELARGCGEQRPQVLLPAVL
jgi:hypothetical protein